MKNLNKLKIKLGKPEDTLIIPKSKLEENPEVIIEEKKPIEEKTVNNEKPVKKEIKQDTKFEEFNQFKNQIIKIKIGRAHV